MRLILVLWVVVGVACGGENSSFDGAVPDGAVPDGAVLDGADSWHVETVDQACLAGQVAVPYSAWEHVEDLSLGAYWNSLDHETYIAVLARRAEPAVTMRPHVSPPAGSIGRLAYCGEQAEHGVRDGLGWIEETTMRVTAGTGRTYWSDELGTPLAAQDAYHSEFFFDSETQSLAPDSEDYLLVLHRTDDGFRLTHRFSIVDGMVSGEGTQSGEPMSLDTFRAP